MYDICHPIYYNMSQLGCNDQMKLTTAFYVYMELCEVKHYWDVEYNYSKELEIFYLEAKKSKNGIVNTFIPWLAVTNINLDTISSIQKVLKKDKFTFVFKEGDTTSVYYSICSGIVKPVSPEESKVVKQKEDKKYRLEREIIKNSSNLYERALTFNTDKEKLNEYSSNNKIETNHTESFNVSKSKNNIEKSEVLDSKNCSESQNSESECNKSKNNDSEKIETTRDENEINNHENESVEDTKSLDHLKETESKKS